jgi:hypothetical protein
VEAADGDLDPGGAEAPRHVHGPRELVGLDPDHADDAVAAGAADALADALDRDQGVGLVVGADLDLHRLAQDARLGCLHRLPVEARQRVGGDPRLEPLDRVAVVVVVGWLDQLDVEAGLAVWGWGRRLGCGAILDWLHLGIGFGRWREGEYTAVAG